MSTSIAKIDLSLFYFDILFIIIIY